MDDLTQGDLYAEAAQEWADNTQPIVRAYTLLIGSDDAYSVEELSELTLSNTAEMNKAVEALETFGIARRCHDIEGRVTYKRDDRYVLWQHANSIISENTVPELDQLETQLETRITQLQSEYGVNSPQGIPRGSSDEEKEQARRNDIELWENLLELQVALELANTVRSIYEAHDMND